VGLLWTIQGPVGGSSSARLEKAMLRSMKEGGSLFKKSSTRTMAHDDRR
jgi:hypothetical protein